MKKFLLLFLLYPCFLFSYFEDIQGAETLLFKGTEAFGKNKFEEAFTYFDMYIIYDTGDWRSLNRTEARLGRFCAAYKLGYIRMAQNEMGLIYMLLSCKDIRDALLEKFPHGMFEVALELY